MDDYVFALFMAYWFWALGYSIYFILAVFTEYLSEYSRPKRIIYGFCVGFSVFLLAPFIKGLADGVHAFKEGETSKIEITHFGLDE